MLKRQTNRTVAFLNPDAGNPFYIQLISQISDVLREAHGYTTIMVPDTKYEHRMVESIRFFLSYHVQCIVFSPINSAVDPRLERLIEKEKSCKFLQLHCKVYPHVSAVHYDDVLGMEIATEHLLRRGHRRILIVSNDAPRIRGCTAAYQKAGIETPAIPVEALPSDVSAEQVVRLVERHRPTAIIAVAEYFGLVTFSALTQLRMRIPEDISLIVYDDTPWTRAMGISVMTHDDQAVVENAVDSILLKACDLKHIFLHISAGLCKAVIIKGVETLVFPVSFVIVICHRYAYAKLLPLIEFAEIHNGIIVTHKELTCIFHRLRAVHIIVLVLYPHVAGTLIFGWKIHIKI